MLYVRVDANASVGAGHLGRCVAVCREARRLGERTTLLTLSDAVCDRAEAEGLRCVRLRGAWDDLSLEASQVIDIVRGCREPKVVLVDTYSINGGYVAALSDVAPVAYLGSKLFDSPDLALAINYSAEFDAAWYALHMPYARTCLGMAYAPLREEFWRPLPDRDSPRNRVLVTMGGADIRGVGLEVCAAILGEGALRGYSVDLVVGPLSPCVEEARALAASRPRVTLHEGVSDMSLLIDQVDGAVTAAGTTLYELCARRVPSVSVAIVEEQVRDARAFDRLGIAPYAGMAGIGESVDAFGRAAKMLGRLVCDGARKVVARMEDLLPSNGTEALVRELMSVRRLV